MTAAVHAMLKEKNLAKLIDETLNEDPGRKNPVPTLQARIQNIGHSEPHRGDLDGSTAAAHYLGASMNSVITLIDKLWLKTLLESRKTQLQQTHEHAITTPVTNS